MPRLHSLSLGMHEIPTDNTFFGILTIVSIDFFTHCNIFYTFTSKLNLFYNN